MKLRHIAGYAAVILLMYLMSQFIVALIGDGYK